jgi:hypothetical protein
MTKPVAASMNSRDWRKGTPLDYYWRRNRVREQKRRVEPQYSAVADQSGFADADMLR